MYGGQLPKGQLERYFFSGDEEMNTTLGAVAISDQTSSYGAENDLLQRFGQINVVRITSNDHGFKAPAEEKRPTYIYIDGTTNYDGIHRIIAVAANTIDIAAKFVAETPGGTETLRPCLSFEEPWLLVGWNVHLDSASATAENMVVTQDAKMGAAWDTKIYSGDWNGVQDLIQMYEPPIPINGGDLVYWTWANTNDRLWGLEILARSIL